MIDTAIMMVLLLVIWLGLAVTIGVVLVYILHIFYKD
jgi:hypothetical protein